MKAWLGQIVYQVNKTTNCIRIDGSYSLHSVWHWAPQG